MNRKKVPVPAMPLTVNQRNQLRTQLEDWLIANRSNLVTPQERLDAALSLLNYVDAHRTKTQEGETGVAAHYQAVLRPLILAACSTPIRTALENHVGGG